MALISTASESINWNLEVLVFEEGGNPDDLEKKPSEKGPELTTNSNYIFMTPSPGIQPGHYAIPCSPISCPFIHFFNN